MFILTIFVFAQIKFIVFNHDIDNHKWSKFKLMQPNSKGLERKQTKEGGEEEQEWNTQRMHDNRNSKTLRRKTE